MSDESWDEIEVQICATAVSAPEELRCAVLRDVRRELTASRWDRRLGRAAAATLALGVGLNAAMAMRGRSAAPREFAPSQEALVQTAAAVAEATDAETGRRMARQLAALGGQELSDEQAAAVDAAIRGNAG